jgi:hypothetical protein
VQSMQPYQNHCEIVHGCLLRERLAIPFPHDLFEVSSLGKLSNYA